MFEDFEEFASGPMWVSEAPAVPGSLDGFGTEGFSGERFGEDEGENPGAESAEEDGDEASGDAEGEGDAGEVGDEDHGQGEHGGEGVDVDLEDEGHGDETDGDAGEGGEEGGAGGGFAKFFSDEAADEFDDARAETGEEAHAPGGGGGLGFEVDGEHDEEDVDEERGGIDAVGEGSDVVAVESFGESMGLPGIEEVAEEDADGGSGEDVVREEAGTFVADHATKGAEIDDEQELDEVVDEQPEESVEITFDKQWVGA